MMRNNSRRALLLALAALALVTSAAQTVLAGPPLLCHPVEIGGAQSLPWEDAAIWRSVKKDYAPDRLVPDTLALLAPDTPVIVRMETIRRATVYAVWTLNDHKVGYPIKNLDRAQELLSRLSERVKEAKGKGNRAESLALFDLGYLAETYRQASSSEAPNPAGGLDGYALVKRAIGVHEGDAEMEFAAALMTLEPGLVASHSAHLKKAAAGATKDSLLARNLAARFGEHNSRAALPKTAPLIPVPLWGVAVVTAPLVGTVLIAGVRKNC